MLSLIVAILAAAVLLLFRPMGFSVCPECGRDLVGRRRLAEVQEHPWFGWLLSAATLVLAVAAVETCSPS